MEDKLSLVNHLLQAVGERSVVSLQNGNPSVTQAIQALEGYNRDFQSKGWWFNTNNNVKLTPNNLGEVLLPTEALGFRITYHNLQWASPVDKSRFVKRGKRLYDNQKNTYQFDRAVFADIVIVLDYEDLPQIAASYLKHKAAHAYYVDDDGDDAKSDKLKERAMEAWHLLQSEQMKVLSTNALDSPSAQLLNYRIQSAGSADNPAFPGGRIR